MFQYSSVLLDYLNPTTSWGSVLKPSYRTLLVDRKLGKCSPGRLGMSTRVSPEQRGGLGPYCGEIIPTLYLLFEPRPKLPTQYRIVTPWSTHSRPRHKILPIEVFNLRGCPGIDGCDSTHRGWVEGQAEKKVVDGTFVRDWKMRDGKAGMVTHC